MDQEQAELEQQAEERAATESAFESALSAFAAEDTPAPPPQAPPKPVVEGDEPAAPDPETDEAADGEAAEAKPADPESPGLAALRKELDSLKRETKKERQRAEYWMNNYQQRAAQPAPEAPKPTTEVKPFLEPKPKLANFETVDQWEDAATEWMSRKATHDAIHNMRQEQAQNKAIEEKATQYTQLKQYVDGRINEGYTKFGQKSFDDAATDLIEYAPFGSPMYQTLLSLGKFSDVVMELAKNTQEAERISRLNSNDQIYELKSLEKKLSAREELARKAQPKTPTKVEAPGAGEDQRTAPSMVKLRAKAKASGEIQDWAKVFAGDTTL
jgi:hypothetical protein